MRMLKGITFISLLISIGCKQGNQPEATVRKTEVKKVENLDAVNVEVKEDSQVNLGIDKRTENQKSIELSKDEEEIQRLIRQVLAWSDSKKSIDLLPALKDSKGAVYVGFDINQHKANLQTLRETNLFAADFIENYDGIIVTLNKKIKNKEFDEWLVGDLPVFYFASETDPWCLCQDVPYDKPSPWSLVEIETLSLEDDNGVFNWKWGKLELNGSPDWKEFKYSFKVKKENNQWKVAYMEGFDFDKSIKG
jgi:hypothetical protein